MRGVSLAVSRTAWQGKPPSGAGEVGGVGMACLSSEESSGPQGGARVGTWNWT